MKHTLLLLASLGVLGIPCLAAEKDAPKIRAGAAAVDITPKEFPLNMPGLFTARMAESAHDPLHARALVLDDGATTVALVVVDNIGVAEEAIDEAKGIASTQCGIAVEKMLVASTHTHTGPHSNIKAGRAPEVAYRKLLVAGIAESIVRAHAALRPAGVGAAASPLPEEVFCRRWFLKPGKMPRNPFGQMDEVKMNPSRSADVLDRPAGPTDPDVTILSVEDAASGKPLALLANYSLHYVGTRAGAVISADYFGVFADRIQELLGADRLGPPFVGVLCNGASGDINNINWLKKPERRWGAYEKMTQVADLVARAVHEAHQKIEFYDWVELDARSRELSLAARKPTEEQLAYARKILAKPEDAPMYHKRERVYANRVMALKDSSDEVSIVVQALCVGDLGVCAIPFEVFAETGLELKEKSPFKKAFTISHANGSYGYLPTPEQHELGGYETWLGTNRVEFQASRKIVRSLLSMLGEMKSSRGEAAK